ncbi:MAG: AsmA family protein [Verrucomicrobia bacterium]|nr:AsmA family protein [Verrucomicrobiota bacterium]
MSNSENELSADNSPKKWPRLLGIGAGALFALLLVAYFVGTSAYFLKSFILPRVGKLLGAQITVADASISPFSKIVLNRLQIQTTGNEPLLTVEEIRVRAGVFALISGNIKVDELAVVAPKLQLIQTADGKSNLDPVLASLASNATPASAKSAKPLQLALRNVSLTQGLVRQTKISKSGGRDVVEVSDINVTLDQLGNAQSGKFTLASGIKVDQAASGPAATAGSLVVKLSGSYEIALGKELLPQNAKGSTRLEVTKAEGAFAQAAALASVLECDLTPTELRQLGLRFERGGKNLGRIKISGPLELAKQEGRLTLELADIDRQVLNLFTAGQGWDVDQSALSSKILIDISQKGQALSVDGKLIGTRLGVKKGATATPPMDLELVYQCSVNLEEKSAILRALKLQVNQGAGEIISGRLDRPMNLSWGTRATGFKDSAFLLNVTNLNLADWQPFLGPNVSAGRVGLRLNVLSQQDGRQIKFDLAALALAVNARMGTNQIDLSQIQFQTTGTLEDLKKIGVDTFQLDVLRRGERLLGAKGTANYRLDNDELGAQTSVDASLTGLLQLWPMPQLNARGGAINLSAVVGVKGERQNVSGSISLDGFTGRYAAYNFEDYRFGLDYRLERDPRQLQLQKFIATIHQGVDGGGSLDLAGKLDTLKNSGQFTFKAVDLNQVALRPFLLSALGEKKLVSASFNGEGTLNYDAKAESTVKGDFKLANLRVDQPARRLTGEPLSAQLQLDAGLKQSALELRRLATTLTPTPRAKNILEMKGRFDFAPTNPAPSQLTVKAESLDATKYYDIFSGATQTNTPLPSPAATARAGEPEPVILPLKQFTLDVDVGKFFLREIAISNLLVTAKANQSKVDLNPCRLMFNGVPVTGTAALDLGVRGFTYNLALDANKLPLEPIANTFSPTTKGQYQGDLNLNARIKGAGTTGPSLQKSLKGNVAFSFTNANIQLLSQRAKSLVTPIAVILRLPEVTSSPLQSVDARIDLGGGRIDLKNFTAASDAFRAESRGSIPIAEVLTNSPLNLPVEISLRRAIAEKSNLIPSDAPANTPFVKLPNFAKVTGTLGHPKTDTDTLVLAGLLAKSLGGIPASVGAKAGNVIQGLGNLLTGETPAQSKPPTTPGAKTNAPPATNQPPAAKPQDLLKNLFKK